MTRDRLWQITGIGRHGHGFVLRVRAPSHAMALRKARSPHVTITDVVLIEAWTEADRARYLEAVAQLLH